MSAVLALALFFGSAAAQDVPTKVTNGTQVQPGQWEDAVGVVFYGSYVGCTGTLVAPDVVLTAGHCVQDRVTHVLVGSTDWDSNEGETIEVAEVIDHPDYNGRSGAGPDIAVLVLEEESSYTPRAMAEGCVLDEFLDDDSPVAVVGYGATDRYGREYGSELIEGYTGVTDADCDSASDGCERSISPGGEIIAGGVDNDGVDACYGDSGGPLYLLTDIGDYLIGITSRAKYGVSVPCGEGGIWVRPDYFGEWIREASGRDIPYATCNEPPVAEVEALLVPQGKSRKGAVDAYDPEGSELVVELLQAPEHGTVELDADGSFEYTANDDYLGSDVFWVGVTDSEGYPLHTVNTAVNVSVVEKSGFLGCSCSTGTTGSLGGYGAFALLGLGLLRRRRS